MLTNPQDKALLSKYSQVAQKIIYNPQRMREFLGMMGTAEGALTAVQTVVAAIDKLRPVPPEIAPMLGVNVYMLMVDVAQEATDTPADPEVMKGVVQTILSNVQTGQPQGAPAQGMLAQMQDAPGPDETPAHEGAEPADYESNEDAIEGEEPEGAENVVQRMQRRGAPA